MCSLRIKEPSREICDKEGSRQSEKLKFTPRLISGVLAWLTHHHCLIGYTSAA